MLPAKEKKTAFSSHLGLMITITIWASTFINIKVVLLQVPPNTLAFLRFLLASLVLGSYLYLAGGEPIKKKDWLWVALSGLTGIALYNFLQNQGLKYAGSTDAAILASMSPVFMAFLAWFILREKISPLQITGILVAFTGSILVATNGSLDSLALHRDKLWGDFLILLTGLVWGFYNICLKKLLNTYPALSILTYSTIAGTILLLPLALLEYPFPLSSIDLWGWLNIIYLGLFASALAYLFWNTALTTVPTVTAGSYLYLIPVIAAIMGVFYYSEIPSLYVVSGGSLTLLGTYLTSK